MVVAGRAVDSPSAWHFGPPSHARVINSSVEVAQVVAQLAPIEGILPRFRAPRPELSD